MSLMYKPSPSPPPTDLAARIERLERENRRFKAVGFLCAASIAALLIMAPSRVPTQAAAPTPQIADEIRAKRFVVVDQAGKVRATLDTQEMGWPYLSRAGLTLYSTDSTRKAVISSDNLLNQVSLENSQPGTGARHARLQVGTEGVGLELSEFFLDASRYNLFGVHWGGEKKAVPTLELTQSKPRASFRVTPVSKAQP